MTLLSFIRRRIISRIHPIFKRVLLPAGALLLVVHVLTWGDRSMLPVGDTVVPGVDDTVLPGVGNAVLPGEALDPLAKPRPRPRHDSRPTNAFETVLRAASQVDYSEDDKSGVAGQVSPPAMVTPSKEATNKRTTSKKKETAPIKKTKKEKKATGELDDIRNSDWSMHKANITGNEKVKFAGHKITEDTVTLTVMSSSDKVFMSLNKREIYRGLDDRGMHVVVLHSHTGKVMATRVFDTFFNGTEEDMISFVDNIQSGRIIVFAVRDEAATGLTWKGRSLLRSLGARFADKLAYRDMWILVTRKGGLKLAESYSNVATEDTAYEWGGPLFLRTDFDLDTTADLCKWESSFREDMRQRFCQRFEGYGDLCRCSVKTFGDAFFKTDPQVSKLIEGNSLYDDLAVAVLASNRPSYLYRTLKALLEAPGVKMDRVVVFLDQQSRETAALVRLMGMQLVMTGRRAGTGNLTTPVVLRDKMQYIFSEMMGASFPPTKVPEGLTQHPSIPVLSCRHLLLLDDDVLVAVDLFKYLHALAPVLENDPTVVGITGFNYNSYSMVANSLTSFYRTGRLNTIALMIPARTLHEYILPRWPDIDSTENWYAGLEQEMQHESSLAILYPEVSRSKHIGYTGHRIKGTLQHAFFAAHKISLTTGYDIPKANIEKLELSAYDAWQLAAVKNGQPLSYNFCKYEYPFGEEPLVVFVNYGGIMAHDKDLTATLKCLGTWHLYGEGDWRFTWHFHYHGHPLTLVSVPASPYGHLLPSDYKMTDMTGNNDSTADQ